MTPAIVLILGGSVLLAASMVMKTGAQRDVYGQRNAMGLLSVLLIAIAGVCGWFRVLPTDLGNGLFRFDDSALAAERLALLGGFLLVLISWSTAPKNFLGEYYVCLIIM